MLTEEKRQEFVRMVTIEIGLEDKMYGPPVLEISRPHLMTVIGALQIALRTPGLPLASQVVVAAFIRSAENSFGKHGRKLISMGFDAEEDLDDSDFPVLPFIHQQTTQKNDFTDLRQRGR